MPPKPKPVNGREYEFAIGESGAVMWRRLRDSTVGMFAPDDAAALLALMQRMAP